VSIWVSSFPLEHPRPSHGRVEILESTHRQCTWRHGVAVERRIRDREVAGSDLGRALRRKNSRQVSHTYG